MYSLFFIRQAFSKKNIFLFSQGKQNSTFDERGAPSAPVPTPQIASLTGCKSTTLFLFRKDFSKLFSPFLRATAQHPVGKHFAPGNFPGKRENNLILFPRNAKQCPVKIEARPR
jgi:hypothetical protein